MANKSDNIIREEARAIEVGEETGGTPQQRRQRDSWASRTGFILACVGSAVGMANIWLFPYRVAQLGGAAFLIPYLIFVALLGFTGVIGEMSFGRAMGTGPMGAFGKAMEMRGIRKGGLIGKIVGLVPTLGSLALAIGYAVVLGWACHYLFSSLTGELMAQSDMGAFFGGIASDFGNVGFHVTGLVITFVIMILGVSRGIERVNKVLMPLLFILFIVIAIRVAMLSGASEGYLYLLVPRWEALLNPTTWVYALGQAFFSLSLAGCGTLVYGAISRRMSMWCPLRATSPFSTRLRVSWPHALSSPPYLPSGSMSPPVRRCSSSRLRKCSSKCPSATSSPSFSSSRSCSRPSPAS